MSLFDYDVVGLGEMELTYEKDKLEDLRQEADFNLTSLNITDLSTGKPYLPEYVILKKGDLRVGVFSVVYNYSDYLTYAFKKIEDFKLENPLPLIEATLKELDKKVDVIVMLSHLGEEQAETMANNFPRINLIVSGHNTYKKMTDKSTTLKKVGETLLVFTNSKSQALGRLDLVFDKHFNLKAYAEINRLLDEKIADHSKIVEVIKDYNIKSKELRGKLFPTSDVKTRTSRKYAGVSSCSECHSAIYDSWQETTHATAMESLEREGKAGEAECLVCHMTGFTVKSEIEESFDASLPGVQCEGCHGKGSRHLEDENKSRIYGKTYKYICQRCHTEEWDPEFNWENDKLLVHPVP